ncbi:hypothetical protein SSP24_55620 [Streptomyces spinoverrucosus]|uniref:Uncharacterized protein n=2 Tax=Streptomyces spinoverrucosus TaxID=284043 RepID=A0A4Y3VM32_9ACTN|nr:hypothetical protein SSP24_55620 [Streptomyces spinoverrucosus]GHB85998.1 hypothetical protein GCM10010397_66920 [Streptomyces spinoverrucosus]
MFAGGVADRLGDELGFELGVGRGAAKAAGAVSETDNRVAEASSSDRRAFFLGAGTIENVHVRSSEVPRPSPPRRTIRTPGGDTERMKLSRPISWFLLAFGVWSWVIWVTFINNLIKDSSGLAFEDGQPTAYFWVHLLLAVVSLVLGTAIGVIGLRGLRALRRKS